MDKIQFQCSGCGKSLSTADRAGKNAKCPSCGVAIQIPRPPDGKPTPVPGAVIPTARSASTAPQYYYTQNGQRLDPFPLNQMEERVGDRRGGAAMVRWMAKESLEWFQAHCKWERSG